MTKKDQIIKSARQLFYENGYDNTSMDMIAKHCSTQKQAISYYFNFKENLALSVYYQIVDENQQIFSQKIKDLGIDNEKIIYAVPVLHTPRFYKSDEKIMRFFNEIVTGILLSSRDISNTRNENFNVMSRYLDHRCDNQMKLFMEYISMCYASKGALLHYCNDEFFVSAEDFAEFYFKLRFQPFISNAENLDNFYTETKTVLEKLDVKIKPCFELE